MVADPVKEVLQRFEVVFAELRTLPPVRALDHTIPLKMGGIAS